MDPRSQRWLLLALIFTVAFVLFRNLGGHDAWKRVRQHSILSGDGAHFNGLSPANATLGFGAVVAVSREGSPRRESLLLASNITEIDITIPVQPKWTDADVTHLRADEGSTINRGSALAWLGHLNALRWFLSTDLSTILILEDDVDWDIHLRTTQIPAAASAIRHLTAPRNPLGEPVPSDPSAAQSYWGNPAEWDILYLGHCGDIFAPSAWTEHIARLSYPDATLPARKDLHPYTADFLSRIGIPEHTRTIHQSVSPLCTFGFALTRPAASRLLHDIAAREAPGGTWAYDVRVLEACRDLGFRCWSASPELFHHMDAESEIANANIGKEGEGEKVGVDGRGRLKGLRVGRTPNIACGIRSKGFFTRERGTMEFLREVVGRQGRCLRDVEEE